jgi:hypothetical protein
MRILTKKKISCDKKPIPNVFIPKTMLFAKKRFSLPKILKKTLLLPPQ